MSDSEEWDEMMAEVSARIDRLIDRLQKQPAVELNCVIHPSGVSGSGGGDSDDWDLLFSVEPWRGVDGEIDRRNMTVRKLNVSREELDDTMERLEQYDVVRLRAHVSSEDSDEDCWDKPQALLIDILETGVDDEDLNECANALKEPVTFESNKLGIFTLDRSIGWYQCFCLFGKTRVRISLEPENDQNLTEVIELAEKLWGSIKTWDSHAREKAVDDLLSLKNDAWLGNFEFRLSARRFKKKMKLESIGIQPDGSFDFWYDDGGMFFGHSIAVNGSFDKGFIKAGIHG